MKTEFRTPEEYAKVALEMSQNVCAVGNVRPERFKKMMKENRGSINMFSPYGPTVDGLERKNPVIVALGDSVTAGHFEFNGNPEELFAKVEAGTLGEDDAVEVTDARVCYLEQFRGMLIDKYEQTSVSTINSGIAGDTIYGMLNRVYRDVVRYQPDLVIINGSLNWNDENGTNEDYEKALLQAITIIKEETKADIVLLTPNMEIRPPFLPEPEKSTLKERVEVMRKLADQEQVCLADTYKIWESYEAAGYPVNKLLANGSNHPSVTGHTMYANVLMQLMK